MNSSVNYPVISVDEVIRPTRVEVDLKILAENFRTIKKHVAPAKVMPVLKANAYGHGLVRVAQLMEELKADWLGVAVLEEGILLRQKGIKIPILVLGGIWGNQIPIFIKHDLAITASSIEKLKQIDELSAQLKKKARVHLKIDTGMERLGVHYYHAEKFFEATLSCKHLIVDGVYSHFANSDDRDFSFAKLQLERFKEAVSFFQKTFIAHTNTPHSKLRRNSSDAGSKFGYSSPGNYALRSLSIARSETYCKSFPGINVEIFGCVFQSYQSRELCWLRNDMETRS